MTPAITVLLVIIIYLGLLLSLGLFSNRFFRGTSKDYFVASQSIGDISADGLEEGDYRALSTTEVGQLLANVKLK